MTILFEPTRLNGLAVRNRIAMAPLTRQRADVMGVPKPFVGRDYHAQRAGAGLIIAEGTQPSFAVTFSEPVNVTSSWFTLVCSTSGNVSTAFSGGPTTYTLDPADDSDSSLYRDEGRPVPVRDLVDLMITVSSNLATNLLIERVGADRTQATVRDLGAGGMVVRRGVEDGPAFRAGIINTTTARCLGTLFATVAGGRAASAASCGAMVDILFRQRFRDGIPAGLPRHGVRVAHKTGEITAVHHDGGIVYMRGRPAYVLVVLTRGLQDRAASATLIADLARQKLVLRVNREVARALAGEEAAVLRSIAALTGDDVSVQADALHHQEQFDVVAR